MKTISNRTAPTRSHRILALCGLGMMVIGCIAGGGQDPGSAQVVTQKDDPYSAPELDRPTRAHMRTDAVTLTAVDMQQRASAIEERAQLRAYFGAPPVIPHEIAQFESAADCLNCHGNQPETDEGNPGVPHAHLASCTQCHVIQEAELFSELDTAGNEFRGLAEPTSGRRAWAGAPPTIPHATLMRSACLTCHGPAGHRGIRTSHPERLSCQQCHAPSAGWNQRQTDDVKIFLSPSNVSSR